VGGLVLLLAIFWVLMAGLADVTPTAQRVECEKILENIGIRLQARMGTSASGASDVEAILQGVMSDMSVQCPNAEPNEISYAMSPWIDEHIGLDPSRPAREHAVLLYETRLRHLIGSEPRRGIAHVLATNYEVYPFVVNQEDWSRAIDWMQQDKEHATMGQLATYLGLD
jgi:hypothetical protein